MVRVGVGDLVRVRAHQSIKLGFGAERQVTIVFTRWRRRSKLINQH